MQASAKVVKDLAKTVTNRLAEIGGRSTLSDLVTDVTSTTGEMKMLVRHAARQAILSGAIVRIRHAREASQDTVIEMSAWKNAAGGLPEAIAYRSSETEHAILHAAGLKSWATMVGRVWEHHDRVPNRALHVHDTGRWTAIRWYDDELITGSHWQYAIPVKTVEVRLNDVSEHDARGHLASQKALDRNDERVMVHRSRDIWPFDNYGAELQTQMDGVLSLHRSNDGWIWFKPLVVRTMTHGAVSVSAVQWSHARRALSPMLASAEALPMVRRDGRTGEPAENPV